MTEEFNCNFCEAKIPIGKGKVYVKNNGTVLRFCSKKCQKNMLKLGRVPRKVKWVKKKTV
ncbi:MAG: 50S ribosomal protein L24e [Candidatus Methanoliparum thermophilum]|uniref:Large ribosomal subunit protein eL24 n=1 Tax=Methanoliparum thermophilum TaxID=2491083 RepID=A0A520KS08_METT2|nr:MAG: 50S ribosomal protein L24e [Candidatus Methanoliparum thermophilum]